MTEKAIHHFQYGVDCDIFQEPVRMYAILAVAALEKQIRKKVELTDDCCICPRCRFDMMGVYDFTDSDTKDPTYCPNCGQALEWGDGV